MAARFSLRNNHCQGWWQALRIDASGSIEAESRRFPTRGEAMQAIRHCMKNGKFPSEQDDVQDEEMQICEACGQPIET